MTRDSQEVQKNKNKKIKNKVNQFTPKQQLQHFEMSLQKSPSIDPIISKAKKTEKAEKERPGYVDLVQRSIISLKGVNNCKKTKKTKTGPRIKHQYKYRQMIKNGKRLVKGGKMRKKKKDKDFRETDDRDE